MKHCNINLVNFKKGINRWLFALSNIERSSFGVPVISSKKQYLKCKTRSNKLLNSICMKLFPRNLTLYFWHQILLENCYKVEIPCIPQFSSKKTFDVLTLMRVNHIQEKLWIFKWFCSGPRGFVSCSNKILYFIRDKYAIIIFNIL